MDDTSRPNYLDGGEAVVQGFRSLGVDYVMASPGSEWGGVWEAFARQKVSNAKGPTYLSCAHETLAVDLAIGYTVVTGRMQAVMLHTGVGLLQGAVGIDGANRLGIPMVVLSGEALTYGEKSGFNPGAQWQANLSVVGSPHRLAEPIVKWSNQASSTETLYQQVVAAGELAQRSPTGPTYLGVPIETQLNEWHPPEDFRMAPPPSKPHAPMSEVETLAKMIAASENPAIVTESAGREVEGFNALVDLAETAGIPVVCGSQSTYANFPKDHPLYLGNGQPDFLDECDLIVTIRCRGPWNPPSNKPKKAKIVSIDETPFRPHMVHHAAQAEMFLEGDAVQTMKLLTGALGDVGLDQGRVDERKSRWSAEHDRMVEADREAAAKVAGNEKIHPITLFSALGEHMPADTFYIDETITHRGMLVRFLKNSQPQTYFRAQGGLGQGLGISLGVKLAAKDRPVVLVIGDGSFMYNPVIQSLAFSHHEDLPIMVVISNNNGYNAMKKEHAAFYPGGVSADHNLYYGHPVTDLEYSEIPKLFGGYGRRVEKPGELADAIRGGLDAISNGKTAVLNVMVDP